MSTFPIGSRTALPYSNVKNTSGIQAGELVAATPLGRDENGKNLVAYIVRTEEEVPSYKLPNNLANSNSQKKSFLSDAQAQTLQQNYAPKNKPQEKPKEKTDNTTALFVKPDGLLNPLEQSQLQQLRARNTAIYNDTTQLNDGAGNPLLTSLVYNTGPDGRRYAIGVSAPLLTQKNGAAQTDDSENELLANSPASRANSAYKKSAYFNNAEYRSGILDKEI